MEIKKNLEDKKLTLAPIGRIDTLTASELEEAVVCDEIDELVFDLAEVDYVSSAGLRVLLASKKRMGSKSMLVKNVCPAVREVFDITGFSDIFTFA